MTIRTATLSDEDQIRQIHLAAFDASERELVATLAIELLRETTAPEILHLVAEEDDDLIGHISFSPVGTMSGSKKAHYILAPLAVNPQKQRKGIGSSLIREGLRLLTAQGVRNVLVYGDPHFYGIFGFATDLAQKFQPPFKLTHPLGWQAITLTDKRPITHSETIECVEPLNKPELW